MRALPDSLHGRLLVLPLAVLWALLWTLTSIIEIAARFLHDPSIPLWQPLVLTAIPTCPMIVWLAIQLRSSHYYRMPIEPPARWFLSHLRQLPVLAIGYIAIVDGLRLVLKQSFLVDSDFHGRIPYELTKVALFYCLWLGLVYGTLSLDRSREQGALLSRSQQALVEAQLAHLQAQLRPHFLFNTLNTVSSLMQTDIVRADRVLTRLGDLLRASLGAGAARTVPLQEEMRILRLYADIMEERFAGRVVATWHIDEEALQFPIPAMLLQPLLENAFKHGVERTTGVERVSIVATHDAERLTVAIHNTGSVLAVGWREGVGIANCRERMNILYGSSASLKVGSDSTGVEASITLPLHGPA